MFNLLKAAYKTAKALKHITINPLVDISFKQFFPEDYSITKAQVRACRLSTDQVPSTLHALESALPNERLLVMMILGHGSRIGETRKAKWSDVSFSLKRWTIPRDNTKSKVEMVYPLSDSMIELLHSYREWQVKLGYEGDYLFPISHTQNSPAYGVLASSWVKNIVSGWSAHDLRKRARSVWMELGVDYIIGEALLNHAKGKLDLVYIHSHVDLKKVEAISNYHEWLKNCWRTCFRPVSTDHQKCYLDQFYSSFQI
nr:tyrosine-type recombinase/integrase [Vibrio coralliilyticus]